MMQFHPDLIATIHADRMQALRGRSAPPRTGEEVRWVHAARTARTPRSVRRRSV